VTPSPLWGYHLAMTVSELIALLQRLEAETAGNAPVVLDVAGRLRVVQSASVETLVQLQPTLYAKTESHRDARRAVVIKS
jgi:hypothetical protein